MEEKIISGIVVAVAVVLFSFNLFSTRDAFYAFWDHESTYTADGYVSGISRSDNGESVSWSDSIVAGKARIKIRNGRLEVNSDFLDKCYWTDNYNFNNPRIEHYREGDIYIYRGYEDAWNNKCVVKLAMIGNKCVGIYIICGNGERSHSFRISKSVVAEDRWWGTGVKIY